MATGSRLREQVLLPGLLTSGGWRIYALDRSQSEEMMKTRNSHYYYRPLSIWRDGQAMSCRELLS